MGGEQAASVLVQVKEAKLKRQKQPLDKDALKSFEQDIVSQYNEQGHPYYSSARLWDDGIIDPTQTRQVLALNLSLAYNAPTQTTEFGVFRI